MAQRTVIGQDRIVYSTDRDLVEQDYEAKEWDLRFREREKSDWVDTTVSLLLFKVDISGL